MLQMYCCCAKVVDASSSAPHVVAGMQPEPLENVGFCSITQGLPVAGTNDEQAAAPPETIWVHCVTGLHWAAVAPLAGV